MKIAIIFVAFLVACATGGLIGGLVGRGISSGLSLAVKKGYLTEDVKQKILVTYGFANTAGVEPLSPKDIETLQVGGDPDIADRFRLYLGNLRKAQLEGRITGVATQAVLTGKLAEEIVNLIAGNSYVAQGSMKALDWLNSISDSD